METEKQESLFDNIEGFELDSDTGDMKTVYQEQTDNTQTESAKSSDTQEGASTTDTDYESKYKELEPKFTQTSQRLAKMEEDLQKFQAQNEILLNQVKLSNSRLDNKDDEEKPPVDLVEILSDPVKGSEFLDRIMEKKMGKALEIIPKLQVELELTKFKAAHPEAVGPNGEILPEVSDIMMPAFKRGATLEEAFSPIKKTLDLISKYGSKKEDVKNKEEQTKPKTNGSDGRVLSAEEVSKLALKSQTEKPGAQGNPFEREIKKPSDAVEAAMIYLEQEARKKGLID